MPNTPNPIRRKQVAKAVLEALSMAGGFALEVSRMWNFVDDLVKPPTDLGERGVILTMLKDQQFIRKVEDKMDPGLEQWVATELGRSYLASL